VSDLLRQLPAVHRVLADPRVAGLPEAVAKAVTRQVIEDLRGRLTAGTLDAVPDVPALVAERVVALLGPKTRRVINATGVVVHTNLGRAPWSPEAVAAATAAAGYCALEVDLETGERGGRLAGVRALLRHLTGAEDALVVNNGAAAVLLALTALARDRDVVVSRGELVEIGGSFRIPDVVTSGGARLVEVGTTNRTRVDDFLRAVGPETALFLRVHPSNFRVVGFTEAPARADLVACARDAGLLLVEDLGSGSLEGGDGEPSVREAVTEGVDLALFSGDKLLGGPQAGVVVGRAEVVRALRRHPMYRALRVGKVTLAALEATLAVHATEQPTPVDAMLATPFDVLAARAEALESALAARQISAEIREATSETGGGAHAGLGRPSRVVALMSSDPDALAHALRRGDPAVVARVADGALLLDVRTVARAEVDALVVRVAAAWSGR